MAKKLLILEDLYPTHYMPHVGRQVMANGGEPQLTGEVGFLEDDQQAAPLPTFAQPQAQEVTQALDVARAAAQPKKEYAPFGVLPLKETDEGIEFDPYAGLLGTVTRPFKYFTETMSGEKPMDPTSDEAIRAATDLAGSMIGGSTAFERPAGSLATGAARQAKINELMDASRSRIGLPPQRVTNPIGMHSHAADVARNLPQQKGTIEQMLAMIRNKPGVNPEELHWSGIEQAFQPGQKVTGEEIAKHFDAMIPQVQETVYKAAGPGGSQPHQLFPDAFQEFVEVNGDGAAEGMFEVESFDDLTAHQRRQVLNELAEEFNYQAPENGYVLSGTAKYDDPALRTPGGKNYREIVLHHPEHKGAEFTESHHDEPNILGHIRVSDMKGPSGESILNVHEFQSDWGQKARTHGVITGREAENKAALIAKRDEVSQKIADLVKNIREGVKQVMIEGGFNEEDAAKMAEQQSPTSLARLFNKSMEEEYLKLLDESSNLHDEIAKTGSRKPAAPYVTSREGQHNTPGWTDLLIKRVLQEAERGGYDKVVWDTPREQGERYMNMPKIVKGMEGYYGDVLPRRFKKVAPNINIGEHTVGRSQNKISYSLKNIERNVPGSTEKLWEAKEQYPDLNNEQLLKVLGLHDKFIVEEAMRRNVDLPRVSVQGRSKRGSDKSSWYLIDDATGNEIGPFSEYSEVKAAEYTFLADAAKAGIQTGATKRSGFEMTPELKEHVRKGLPAYREGGEVESALHIAKSLR